MLSHKNYNLSIITWGDNKVVIDCFTRNEVVVRRTTGCVGTQE
jgi:hypothetical protein